VHFWRSAFHVANQIMSFPICRPGGPLSEASLNGQSGDKFTKDSHKGAIEDHALHFTRSPYMPGRLFPWTAMRTLPMLDPTRPSRGTRTTNQSLTWKVASQNVIVITSSLSSYTVSITNNLAGLEDLDNHLSFLVFFSFMDTAISAFKPQQPWSEDRTPNGFSLLTGLPVDIAFFQLNWKGLEPDNSTQWIWSRTPLMDFLSRHPGISPFSRTWTP
jgi:hypothetical protein